MIKIQTYAGVGNQIFMYIACRLSAYIHNYDYYITESNNHHKSFLSDLFLDLDFGKNNGNIKYSFVENSKSFESIKFLKSTIKNYGCLL